MKRLLLVLSLVGGLSSCAWSPAHGFVPSSPLEFAVTSSMEGCAPGLEEFVIADGEFVGEVVCATVPGVDFRDGVWVDEFGIVVAYAASDDSMYTPADWCTSAGSMKWSLLDCVVFP